MENNDNKTFAETKKSKGGLVRVWRAFTYSCAGFSAAFKHEHAFRQEVFFFAPLAVFACALPVSLVYKALLLSALVLVLGFEMINSALEAVVDDISLEYRALAKRAKDLGSASVFCAMTIAALVWISVIASGICFGDFDGWFAYVREIFCK